MALKTSRNMELDEFLGRYTPDQARYVRYDVRRFRRVVGVDPLKATNADLERFVARARRDLAAASVKTTVNRIRQIAKSCRGVILDSPRISLPRPEPNPPSGGDICRAYKHCHEARWPSRNAAAWWRASLLLLCLYGPRRSDWLALRWSLIDEHRTRINAGKTGRVHELPTHPALWRHLQVLIRENEFVFRGRRSFKQVYREFDRISAAAGIEPLRPQRLRQYAISQWYAVSESAGRIIHGCGIGVLGHYVEQSTILSQAQARLCLPDCFLTPSERRRDRQGEQELIASYRRASRSGKRVLQAVAQRFS